jgi:predicted AlkP superfamily pyrophosphatase or phosphodiesterase
VIRDILITEQRTLGEVDEFAHALHHAIEARNLTSIVDIIFVSDHGMTDTSHPTFLYMDDESLLGKV